MTLVGTLRESGVLFFWNALKKLKKHGIINYLICVI